MQHQDKPRRELGIVAIIGLVVALVAWLAPFDPIGPSPFSSRDESPTENNISGTKCQQLQNSFPQTLDDVREKFNLPQNYRNFRLVYEQCGAIANGFIFEGSTEFELQVPDGGCIDSYSGAYFSTQPEEESSGGLRAYSGIVRATGMTYRAAWCETKP